jgi:cellulose synthase/poly-beta-1,6-N-acetylglucosamine synthase-like glycosyltransferase
VPDLVLVPVIAVYVAILALLLAYSLNFLYLTWRALRLPTSGPDVPVPGEWPVVTVQLPIYNEVYVVERLIDACVRLEYSPGALEIQVLDDSTDETAELVAALVAHWQRLGIDIRHIRRDRRTGYKAGALAAGLSSAHGTLIAILDADFVPPPDFLTAGVPVLVADPGLAFVQARWGHVNRDDSLLTSLQALSVDSHFAVEQQARAAGGYWFNFNGTAGIWRREAIDDAGGWRDDTLTEDLDISYRAGLRGWRAAYLGGHVVPGELPVSINAYRRQQHRWARGGFECSLKLLPTIWRSMASLPMKIQATLHLTGYSIHLLMLALALLYPLILIGALHSPVVVSLASGLGLVSLMLPVPGILAAVGQERLGRSWIRAVPRIAMLSVLGAGMMVNTARAGWQAITTAPATFERTPKFGQRDGGEDWRRMRYQVAIDRIVAVELALAVVNAVSAWAAVLVGLWPIAIYGAIFAAGLTYVSMLTIAQSMRRTLAGRGRSEPSASASRGG